MKYFSSPSAYRQGRHCLLYQHLNQYNKHFCNVSLGNNLVPDEVCGFVKEKYWQNFLSFMNYI